MVANYCFKVQFSITDVFPTLQSLLHTAREKKPRGRYARLEEEMERSNQDYIEQQRNQQQVIIARQDEQLDQVGASVSTLKRIGETIGDELDDQQV